MDDPTDGFTAHVDIGCANSEEIDFSSDNNLYSEAVWPSNNSANPKSAKSKSQPISLAKARTRLKPANNDRVDLNQVIIGSSAQSKTLRESIELYAQEDAPVLITGETGVGKELVADRLHFLSQRSNAPFVPLNIGAITETLSTAELFGHTKGSFTGALADRDGAFQMANGGSLFLDEIGDTPASIQAQLLRVLDDGLVTKIGGHTSHKVDLRLIAATNVDLSQAVSAGKFRRDLYYRINVLVIDVPPLRDRGDDVIEIAQAMIAAHPNKDRRKKKLTPSAVEKLKAHHFPGNVRELRNVMTRAIIHANGPKIYDEHLSFASTRSAGQANDDLLDIANAKELISRFLIMKALKVADGNVSQAAKLTGRARGTVHTIKKQLDGEDFATVYKSACAQVKALVGDC